MFDPAQYRPSDDLVHVVKPTVFQPNGRRSTPPHYPPQPPTAAPDAARDAASPTICDVAVMRLFSVDAERLSENPSTVEMPTQSCVSGVAVISACRGDETYL